MQMIFIGPPGAGKGTQAARLLAHYSMVHISTGDMLRAAVKAKSPMGVEADKFMSAGKLVPDEVIIGMVKERIAQPDAKGGFMLDGFPRTVPQAKALAKEVSIDAVVLLEVPDSLIVDRITGRRTDPETGTIYHVSFNPPPAEVADRVVQRKDDTEEVCRQRLELYHSQTAPIVPLYEADGIVKRIDGTGTPDEVTVRIRNALK